MNSPRETGIDLLRIFCMFLIVMGHVLGQGGVLWYVTNFSASYYVVWFLNTFGMCAVNCFALISGYVGVNRDYKIKKLFSLWLTVVFYGLICFVTFNVLKRDSFNLDMFRKLVMPFTQGKYWYISAYAGMFFFIPILNAAIRNMSQKELFGCLLGIFGIFTIIPTIYYNDTFLINHGFSTLWLCIMYLTGGYIKRFEINKKVGKIAAISIYIGCSLVTWLGKTLSETMSMRMTGNIRFGYLFIQYSSPFVVLAAIGLLLFFANINIKNNLVNKCIIAVSKTTLSVYLIHVEPYIFYQLLTGVTIGLAYKAVPDMLIKVLALSIAIYVLCTVADFIRMGIFSIVGKCIKFMFGKKKSAP